MLPYPSQHSENKHFQISTSWSRNPHPFIMKSHFSFPQGSGSTSRQTECRHPHAYVEQPRKNQCYLNSPEWQGEKDGEDLGSKDLLLDSNTCGFRQCLQTWVLTWSMKIPGWEVLNSNILYDGTLFILLFIYRYCLYFACKQSKNVLLLKKSSGKGNNFRSS